MPPRYKKGRQRQPSRPMHFDGFTSSEEDEPIVRDRRRWSHSMNSAVQLKTTPSNVVKNWSAPRRSDAQPQRLANTSPATKLNGTAMKDSKGASIKSNHKDNAPKRRRTVTESPRRNVGITEKRSNAENTRKRKPSMEEEGEFRRSNGTSRNKTESTQRPLGAPVNGDSVTTTSQGWRNKAQLLEIARRHNGMAIQYRVTYHESAAPVKDHNPGSCEKIHQGDLCVQSRFVCVSGNSGGCSYSFKNWKLPGNLHSTRKAGYITIYSDTRPKFYNRQASEISFPVIVIDSCLTDADRSNVLHFLLHAPSGTTPEIFGFTTERRRRSLEPAAVTGDEQSDPESKRSGTESTEGTTDHVGDQGHSMESSDDEVQSTEKGTGTEAEACSHSSSGAVNGMDAFNDDFNACNFDDTSTEKENTSPPDSAALNLNECSTGNMGRKPPASEPTVNGAVLLKKVPEDNPKVFSGNGILQLNVSPKVQTNILENREDASEDGSKDEKWQRRAIRLKRKATIVQSRVDKRPRRRTYGGMTRRHRRTVSFAVGSMVSSPPQFFALIEGVGGGQEEAKEAGSDCGNAEALPHRGRLIELPGEVRKGRWAAEVVDVKSLSDGSTRAGLLRDRIKDLEGVRICLRHDKWKSLAPLKSSSSGGSSNASPQDATSSNKTENVIVTGFNPSHNRVWNFLSQGILDEDEIGSKGRPYIGSISVVSFDGFTSSSEATRAADGVSSRFLSSCRSVVLPTEKGGELSYLLPVPKSGTKKTGGQNGDSKGTGSSARNVGISFPCKIQLDDQYNLLVAQDKSGFVVAVDVRFSEKVNPSVSSLCSSVSSIVHKRAKLTTATLKEHTETQKRLRKHDKRDKKKKNAKAAKASESSPDSDLSFGHHSQSKAKAPHETVLAPEMESIAEADNDILEFDIKEGNSITDGPLPQCASNALDKQALTKLLPSPRQAHESTRGMKSDSRRQPLKVTHDTNEKKRNKNSLTTSRVTRDSPSTSTRSSSVGKEAKIAADMGGDRNAFDAKETHSKKASTVTAKKSPERVHQAPAVFNSNMSKTQHVSSRKVHEKVFTQKDETKDTTEKKVTFRNVSSVELRNREKSGDGIVPPSGKARKKLTDLESGDHGGATTYKTPTKKAAKAVFIDVPLATHNGPSLDLDRKVSKSSAASRKADTRYTLLDGKNGAQELLPKKVDSVARHVLEETTRTAVPFDKGQNGSRTGAAHRKWSKDSNDLKSKRTRESVIASESVAASDTGENMNHNDNIMASQNKSPVGVDKNQSRSDEEERKTTKPLSDPDESSKVNASSNTPKTKQSVAYETGDPNGSNRRASTQSEDLATAESQRPLNSVRLPLVTPLQQQAQKFPSLDHDRYQPPSAVSGTPFGSRLENACLSKGFDDERCNEDNSSFYSARASLESTRRSLLSPTRAAQLSQNSDAISVKSEESTASVHVTCHTANESFRDDSFHSHWPSIHDVFYGVHDEREHLDCCTEDFQAIRFDERHTDSFWHRMNEALWGPDQDGYDEHVFETAELSPCRRSGGRCIFDYRRLLLLAVLSLCLPFAQDPQVLRMTMPVPMNDSKRKMISEMPSRSSLFHNVKIENARRGGETSSVTFVIPYFATIFVWLSLWGW